MGTRKRLFGRVSNQTVVYRAERGTPLEHVRPKNSRRHPNAHATIPHPSRPGYVIDLIFPDRK